MLVKETQIHDSEFKFKTYKIAKQFSGIFQNTYV